jgi:hypothetical protein
MFYDYPEYMIGTKRVQEPLVVSYHNQKGPWRTRMRSEIVDTVLRVLCPAPGVEPGRCSCPADAGQGDGISGTTCLGS